MKKISILVMVAIVLAGSAIGTMVAPTYAQVYVPAPPPPPPAPHPASAPWVGPNTPWVFYNGDWFLNGILYYFFGNKYGWAPYYAYAPTYIVRPNSWYVPSWNAWYQQHPVYWQNFQRKYPYWRGHQIGRHYDQNFYNRYHRGQGEGWQKGFHGGTYHPPQPERRNLSTGHGVQPDTRRPGPAGGREIPPGYRPGGPDRDITNRPHGTTGAGYGPPSAAQPGQFQPHGQPAPRQPGQGGEPAPYRHPSE